MFDDPIWTEKEFAAYINQSIRSVKRMRSAGNAPIVTRLSKHRVGFRLSHVKEWLAARIESPPGAGGLDAGCGGLDAGGVALSDHGAHHE
jgi:hypothetical protein